MIRRFAYIAVTVLMVLACFSFSESSRPEHYVKGYNISLNRLLAAQQDLYRHVSEAYVDGGDLKGIRNEIHEARLALKSADFWLRYLAPAEYRRINGPLPVEWETEAFEKFEKPYRHEGSGLTLAELYLDEPVVAKDSLLQIIKGGIEATQRCAADTITRELSTFHHFFLCNRLFLLNLSAIYTTGFECPDTTRIIPELRAMLHSVRSVYSLYQQSFPEAPLSASFIALFDSTTSFVDKQPATYSGFDHFAFIRDYVNRLFEENAAMIRAYSVASHSLVDYSLSKSAVSIFDKSLYRAQNPKGVFSRVKDTAVLAEITNLGKLLFYDPVLSGNNRRSCASCHKPEQAFADTTASTALAFDEQHRLTRNTPSLLNAEYNHLLMMDGAHISLQSQAAAVTGNPAEMGSEAQELVRKVMSCEVYRKGFSNLLAYTPQEPQVCFAHIASALTTYYCSFSDGLSPFDKAMSGGVAISSEARAGFNLFMSKAQCGTCHFLPQFNGVKPPFVGSEFEVLGVPADTAYKSLSADSGRYLVNAAYETMQAFRTGTLRNIARTAPYMHNGVFHTLRQVVDFYDGGGGAGHGLRIFNQTLSAEKLHLSESEKYSLIAFMECLTEEVRSEQPPKQLPHSRIHTLNHRLPGGQY